MKRTLQKQSKVIFCNDKCFHLFPARKTSLLIMIMNYLYRKHLNTFLLFIRIYIYIDISIIYLFTQKICFWIMLSYAIFGMESLFSDCNKSEKCNYDKSEFGLIQKYISPSCSGNNHPLYVTYIYIIVYMRDWRIYN